MCINLVKKFMALAYKMNTPDMNERIIAHKSCVSNQEGFNYKGVS